MHIFVAHANAHQKLPMAKEALGNQVDEMTILSMSVSLLLQA